MIGPVIPGLTDEEMPGILRAAADAVRKVIRLLEQRPGLQRVEVDLGQGPERAYVLTQLTGDVALDDGVDIRGIRRADLLRRPGLHA